MNKTILIILVFVQVLLGQEFQWQWTFSNTGTGNINPRQIFPLNNGDLIIVGEFNGAVKIGDYNFYTSQSFKLFAARISTTGQCIWAKVIQDLSDYASYLIDGAIDNQDNVIILAQFIKFGSDSFKYLIKVNPQGQIIWSNKPWDNMSIRSIATDNSGNIYLAGSEILKKYNTVGEQTDSIITNIYNVESLLIDNYGYYIFVTYQQNLSYYYSTIEIFDQDFTLIRHFSFLWVYISDLILSTDNSISISGYTENNIITFNDTTIYFPSFNNMMTNFILDYNYNTNKVSNIGSLAVGKSWNHILDDIRTDYNGNKFILGSFMDSLRINENTYYSDGKVDVFVANYKNGDLKLIFQGGSNSDYEYSDYSRGLALADGALYIASDFMGDAVFGDTIVHSQSQSGSSIAISKLSLDTALGIGNEISFKLFQNYPNPFNSTTKIDFQIENNSFVTIKIYDLLGQEIQTLISEEKSPGYYQVEFNGSIITSGIYFYRISTETFSDTKKLVLLK